MSTFEEIEVAATALSEGVVREQIKSHPIRA
jgi:hypothetical protein